MRGVWAWMQEPPMAAQRLAIFIVIAGAMLWINHVSELRGERRQDELTDGCRRAQLIRGALLVAANDDPDRRDFNVYRRTFQVVNCYASVRAGHTIPLTQSDAQRYLFQIRRGAPISYNP